jgi:hypothetical protein
VTDADEAVPGAVVSIRSRSGEQTIQSGPDGALEAEVPVEPLVVRVTGKNLVPLEKLVGATDTSGDLRLVVSYAVPPIHESIVIVDTWLDPGIDRRNQEIYDRTLFSRDDQLFDTLASGINAGQHEGGGKSLEVRRFGFNLDHGGVNGGLKVLVDGVQQNHGTQGHGQGYLGQLKSLTPELVQEVSILNGPFSAQYGDFSGLGVVHIRLKESLPDLITLRLQGGSFDSYRSFFAYSPALDSNQAYIAYELSRTDGPFLNPLQYKRDNLTGNFIWKIDEAQSIGFKINYGRNDYFSSGQIPLDEVARAGSTGLASSTPTTVAGSTARRSASTTGARPVPAVR